MMISVFVTKLGPFLCFIEVDFGEVDLCREERVA